MGGVKGEMPERMLHHPLRTRRQLFFYRDYLMYKWRSMESLFGIRESLHWTLWNTKETIFCWSSFGPATSIHNSSTNVPRSSFGTFWSGPFYLRPLQGVSSPTPETIEFPNLDPYQREFLSERKCVFLLRCEVERKLRITEENVFLSPSLGRLFAVSLLLWRQYILGENLEIRFRTSWRGVEQ